MITTRIEKPVLFSAPMVRANRDGIKTQTRRLFHKLRKFGPITQFGRSDTAGYDWHFRDAGMRWHDLKHDELLAALPYQAGDRLWVREAWAPLSALTHGDPGTQALAEGGFYRADGGTVDGEISKWRPSIHMPRHACRNTMIVESVRVERLQDITEADAIAEGMRQVTLKNDQGSVTGYELWEDPKDLANGWSNAGWRVWENARGSYQQLWSRLHGYEGPKSWAANPWVIAYTYKMESAA